MVDEIDFGRLDIKLLTEDNYCGAFDCSDSDELGLNEFYHEEALDYQKERSGITYCFSEKDTTLGFVTLSMADILATDLTPEQRLGLNHVNLPALHIGRLATDNSVRGMHLGIKIVKWSIGFAVELSKYLGCRYLVLQTNTKKSTFYTQIQCGFKIFHEQEEDFWLARKLEFDDYFKYDRENINAFLEFLKSLH